MNIIAIDTETLPFGPDGVTPRVVCTTWAQRTARGRDLVGDYLATSLVSNGDGEEMLDRWREWLMGDDMLVFLNNAYDLNCIITTFPELEPLVWDKLERGEIDDVKIREKLLALSTHGNLRSIELPDGSKRPLGYSMADLVLSYIGDDLSADKGPDSVRTHYDLYDGLPSEQYPRSASDYAKKDAFYTLAIYEHQEARIESESGPASCATSRFRAAVDFALLQVTANGMRTDRAEFERVRALMEEVLAEENLETCIRAGVIRPASPMVPHVRQTGKALALLKEWGVSLPTSQWAGVLAVDIQGKRGEEQTPIAKRIMPEGAKDWGALDAEVRARLEAESISFKSAKKMSVNTKVLAHVVKTTCRESGTEIKRTDTGGVCCDSEVIDSLEAFSPIIGNFKHYQEQQKIVSTELPGMMWPHPKVDPENADLAPRIHFCYDVLVSTGRTSSFASKHYPSRNGQQIDPRVRPCYLPEEGCWLLSVDFSSLELCSVAQTTYELFGQSVHRDKINDGYDLHSYLGGRQARRLSKGEFRGSDDPDETYRMFKALQASNDTKSLYKHWRTFGKPVGLGYPGGLGAKTFIGLAKKTYGVDIIQAALSMDERELEINHTVLWHAQQVGIPENEFRWTPFLKGVSLASMLKNVWLETYPEMVAYFEWVKNQRDPSVPADAEDALLVYTSPMGMYRAGATYTACANGKAMQTPSAEGFCAAFYHLQKATRVGNSILRRCKVHDEIHDEFVLSVPADQELAWEAICAVQDIAEGHMSSIMPDVRISTEAALSTVWRKEAEPVYDPGTGLLVPWEPDVEYENEGGVLYLPS